MTRITIPVVECNACHARDLPVDTESTVITVKFPGEPVKTYSGENCKTCGDGLLTTVVPALEDYLALEPTSPKRRQKHDAADEPTEPIADRTCPSCGSVHASRRAMRQHVRQDHNTNLRTLGAAKPTGRRSSKTPS